MFDFSGDASDVLFLSRSRSLFLDRTAAWVFTGINGTNHLFLLHLPNDLLKLTCSLLSLAVALIQVRFLSSPLPSSLRL